MWTDYLDESDHRLAPVLHWPLDLWMLARQVGRTQDLMAGRFCSGPSAASFEWVSFPRPAVKWDGRSLMRWFVPLDADR